MKDFSRLAGLLEDGEASDLERELGSLGATVLQHDRADGRRVTVRLSVGALEVEAFSSLYPEALRQACRLLVEQTT